MGGAGTPVTDSRVRYPDIHHGTQDQSDITKLVLVQVMAKAIRSTWIGQRIRLKSVLQKGWIWRFLNSSEYWRKDKATAFPVCSG